jgi:hypothetical protein
MKMNPKVGHVLQGYFRVEQFRSTGNKGTGIQPTPPGRPTLPPPRPDLLPAHMWGTAVQPKPVSSAPGVPRPDLIPAKMRGMVGQPKPERETSSPWSRAPRPELLPGMGPAIMGGLRVVAQARSNNGVSTAPIPAGMLRVIGEGRPLDVEIRRIMESFFQADFSGVRVHEGPAARAMGALAFTLGEDLHFAPGLYDPKSREGIELLGHELTHVVQQRDGRVSNPYGRGVAIVQDPGLEAEAEAMGRRAAAAMGVGQAAKKASTRLQFSKQCSLTSPSPISGFFDRFPPQRKLVQCSGRRPSYLWRDPQKGTDENDLELFGCAGHIHPATLSNDSDYIITVWTPGVIGHEVKWYIQDTWTDMDVVQKSGTPTKNETRLLHYLFDQLYYRYYPDDDDEYY